MKITHILILLISLSNIFCSKFPFSFDFNFDLDLNLNFSKFINTLKSSTPDFVSDIQKNVVDFIKKTDKEKDKYIETMTTTVQELYEQIKIGVDKGSQTVKKEVTNLIEKTTETAKILSLKICDLTKIDYQQCYIDKKKIFSNLMKIVDENFGKCSILVNQIFTLSENPEKNLKYFLIMIISLTENPDAIEKGTSLIIYDMINCIQEKFPQIWTSIDDKISSTLDALNIKQDLISLLVKSISNFGKFIKYEEIYGYIEEANNITGLIKNEKAIQVYNTFFKILKKFNEFGKQVYNISADLNINIFTKDNSKNKNISSDSEEKIYYENKGIRISLHLEYILKNFKAYSVQTVAFESPLVSLRGKREKKGGTANTFVGITLYDEKGNEIFVKDIKLEKYRPIIYFKKKLYKSMKKCLFYNEEKNEMDSEGIKTELFELDGEEYIKCIPSHLSSFSVGSYDDDDDILEKAAETNNFKYGFYKGIGIIIILFSVFYMYRGYKRKRIREINNQYGFDK